MKYIEIETNLDGLKHCVLVDSIIWFQQFPPQNGYEERTNFITSPDRFFDCNLPYDVFLELLEKALAGNPGIYSRLSISDPISYRPLQINRSVLRKVRYLNTDRSFYEGDPVLDGIINIDKIKCVKNHGQMGSEQSYVWVLFEKEEAMLCLGTPDTFMTDFIP